ncbi:MAG: hypothetical protein J6J23_03255 [Clostridia bacterium]|nr:hypothetical protein [Clostridia bacterium]
MKKSKKEEAYEIAPRFKLEDIDELKIILIIAKISMEDEIIERLEKLGGHVLLREVGEGIGKNMSLELLGINNTPYIVILATARKEDADNIVVAIDSEVNFSAPGVGLGLTIDVEGYMGAKGLFL